MKAQTLVAAVLGGAAINFTALVGPPAAGAELDHYFRTMSGAVRCVVTDTEVACERTSADGFPQAPASSTGTGRWNLAIVTAAGDFRWEEGNIGGSYAERDMPLVYGIVEDYSGWIVDPSSSGTRFTNINSGHGMFVSMENTYAF